MGSNDQLIRPSITDAIVSSWLWSTATLSYPLGYFSCITSNCCSNALQPQMLVSDSPLGAPDLRILYLYFTFFMLIWLWSKCKPNSITANLIFPCYIFSDRRNDKRCIAGPFSVAHFLCCEMIIHWTNPILTFFLMKYRPNEANLNFFEVRILK